MTDRTRVSGQASASAGEHARTIKLIVPGSRRPSLPHPTDEVNIKRAVVGRAAPAFATTVEIAVTNLGTLNLARARLDSDSCEGLPPQNVDSRRNRRRAVTAPPQ